MKTNMIKSAEFARIKSLENILLYHKYLYYNGKAIITDREYDILEDELRKLYPKSEILNNKKYLECPNELWPKYEAMYRKYVKNENNI